MEGNAKSDRVHSMQHFKQSAARQLQTSTDGTWHHLMDTKHRFSGHVYLGRIIELDYKRNCMDVSASRSLNMKISEPLQTR